MNFRVFSLRSSLLLLTFFGVLCGIIAAYLRVHHENFVYNDLLPAVKNLGFIVESDQTMMRVDGEHLSVSQLDLRSAVAIVGIGDRFRFEIVGCKVTSEALNAFKHFAPKLLGVALINCEITAEKPTGLFVDEFSKEVGNTTARVKFGR